MTIPKSDRTLVSLLLALLGLGAFALIMVLAVYALHFRDGLSANHGTWAEFGDYVGGTLNPIFAFLSFTALVLALAVQTQQLHVSVKQLEASQAELEATRSELKRSADAQASTAAALEQQARMAALSAKITALSKAIDALDRQLDAFTGVDLHHSAYQEKLAVASRRSVLAQELNSAIDTVRSAA